MRQLISGVIGVLWGGGIIVRWLIAGPRIDNSYGVGAAVGAFLGLLIFVAGAYYLYLGVLTLKRDAERRRPRKRKRRLREYDDE